MDRYPYLQQLNCFNLLKDKLPEMLDYFESEMKWYE